MNKQYYDSFCSKECLESNSIKHLAYSKRALDRIVSQESSRSALVSSSNKGIDCTPLLSDIGSCNKGIDCTPLLSDIGSCNKGIDCTPLLSDIGSCNKGIDCTPLLSDIGSCNKGIDCTPLLSDIGSCNNDEHYNVKNSLDNSITNHNSSNVLLSILEHKASAAVTKRFNKDIAKKLGANRKTVNPPLSIIAPNESC